MVVEKVVEVVVMVAPVVTLISNCIQLSDLADVYTDIPSCCIPGRHQFSHRSTDCSNRNYVDPVLECVRDVGGIMGRTGVGTCHRY